MNQDISAVTKYLRSGGWLTEFQQTQKFTSLIKKYVNMPYAQATTSGTAALYLTLLAHGIKPGDKVLVPNFSMVATVNAILWCKAEPTFLDIESDSLCADWTTARVDKKTKAFVYVSFNGRSGNMSQVKQFCKRHKVILIEDSAFALGSKWNNRALGSFGASGIYSFTPHKIITTGQGGMVVTSKQTINKKIEKLKDFYRLRAGVDKHQGIGLNFKYTDLQASLGLSQAQNLDSRINLKKNIYNLYHQYLRDISSITFIPTDLTQVVPGMTDILLPNERTRNKLANYLEMFGVSSRKYYVPFTGQKIYSPWFIKGLNCSLSISKRGLWLPSYLNLQENQIDFICTKIRKILTR